MSNTLLTQSITIRSASAADAAELTRLAQRDSAVVPDGEILVAEADGALRAAVAIDSGLAIADPFHRTADLVELLRTRAERLRRSTPLRLIASSPRPDRQLAA
jgi:hypothetical protein